jgi:hypothetical protein
VSTSVALLIGGFAVLNIVLVLWSQWSSRSRTQHLHHRLDILSHDLGELQARVSVTEQERKWQEEVARQAGVFHDGK